MVDVLRFATNHCLRNTPFARCPPTLFLLFFFSPTVRLVLFPVTAPAFVFSSLDFRPTRREIYFFSSSFLPFATCCLHFVSKSCRGTLQRIHGPAVPAFEDRIFTPDSSNEVSLRRYLCNNSSTREACLRPQNVNTLIYLPRAETVA